MSRKRSLELVPARRRALFRLARPGACASNEKAMETAGIEPASGPAASHAIPLRPEPRARPTSYSAHEPPRPSGIKRGARDLLGARGACYRKALPHDRGVQTVAAA